MKTTKGKRFSKAYACTPQDLRRLVEVAFGGDSSLRYEVECIDGSTLYPQVLDELLGLNNPAARAINKIIIRSSYQTDISIRFVLENEPSSSTAQYSVEGDDKDVYIISRDIEECLDAMTQRFSFIAVGFFPAYMAPVLLGYFGGACVLLPLIFIVQELQKSTSDHHKITRLILFTVVGILISIFSRYFTKMRANLFPAVSFRIGDGENRFERSSSRRKQLGFSALVALSLGIVGSLIASAITQR